MRDYIREMMDSWTQDGQQAAYNLVKDLHEGIRNDIAHLMRQESAIKALTSVLRADPSVDTSLDPQDPEPGLDTIEPAERSRVIVEAAKEAYGEREQNYSTAKDKPYIKTEEVLKHLTDQGFSLGVQNPLAVIGTVLASADGFARIAKNTFEFHQTSNFGADDLPF